MILWLSGHPVQLVAYGAFCLIFVTVSCLHMNIPLPSPPSIIACILTWVMMTRPILSIPISTRNRVSHRLNLLLQHQASRFHSQLHCRKSSYQPSLSSSSQNKRASPSYFGMILWNHSRSLRPLTRSNLYGTTSRGPLSSSYEI